MGGNRVAVVPKAYIAPSKAEQGLRARAELRTALQAIRRDSWVGAECGWGLARPRFTSALVVITSINLEQVRPAHAHLNDGELELLGWTLTGALRVHARDELGRVWAEKYLARVLPCGVSQFNSHPFTDEHDAIRALEKALQLASSDAGLIDINGGTARGAAASPPLRAARSRDR